MSTDSEIVEVVDRYWEDNHRPVLLSALGGMLSEATKGEIANNGVTLGQYIRRKLAGHVRLLRLASHGGGAAPHEKTEGLTDNELEALVPAPIQRLELARTRSPKFHEALWTLFRNAEVDSPVYVELTDGNGAVVHDAKPPIPDANVYEVLPADLPLSDTKPIPIAVVSRAIRAWASKHDIALSSLHSVEGDGGSREFQRRSSIVPVGLGDALNLLSPDELRRISIPADIVLNVLKRL